MSISVDLITAVEDLSQADIETWNALASNPFQRWEWLGSWWRAYGGKHSLHVIAVRRNDQIIGFAPWYIENRVAMGQTIQFLGSGKACTDHLSLLVRPHDRQEVCDAVADWLARAGTMRESIGLPLWDAIELVGVDAADEPVNCLCRSLRACGLEVNQSEGMGCYVIDLPERWEDYVGLRSKSGRREVRQSLKNIDNGTITVEHLRRPDDLDEMWNQFVILHQRRRHASGSTGCFDHPPFGDFLREAAFRLQESGMLELVIASQDDVPVAAQFAVVDETSWYFYQSGMEPHAADIRPGLSVFCHSIRETIRSGRSRFDMMRGDEPYKQRWCAMLQPAQEIRVCSPRTAARLRNRVYSTGLSLKNLLKSSTASLASPNQAS